jgi:hypothetical protein
VQEEGILSKIFVVGILVAKSVDVTTVVEDFGFVRALASAQKLLFRHQPTVIHPNPTVQHNNTMASALRLSTSTLRTSLVTPSFNARAFAFNGLRCYSSAKTQVMQI